MWMQNFSRFRTVWLFCCRRLCWFKAPVDAEAAADDLQLYKLLLAHERISVFKDIFDAALSIKKTSWVFERTANVICSVFSPTVGAH